MAGRPRKPPNLPTGLHLGQAVKISSKEFKGFKLGIIYSECKYDDGIIVYLTSESIPGVSIKTICIQTEQGDTIEGIEIETKPSI